MALVARARWPVAVLCAAWAAAFSWDEPRGTLLAVPLVLVGAALLPRRATAGAALVVAAVYVTFLAGATWGNIDMVVPVAVAMFALGRASDRRWLGILGVLASALGAALRDGATIDKLAITTVLFGVTWVFGVVVRRRALDAFAAVARAEVLSVEDPAAAAAERAVEERSRLADDALFALRSAVIGMRATARQAAVALDPEVVRAVHDRGAAAVTELRALLGLLREPETSPRPASSERTLERRAPWLAGTPALWCLVLAAASVVVAAFPPDVPELLLPGAAAYVVAAWCVATRPSPLGAASLLLLGCAGVWVSATYGARGTGFVLFVFGAAVLAGLAWGERDRILRAARAREVALRARLSEALATAVRAERLRLARELHDVASHAVGAMVLQAGAAAALRERDPDAAREALRTVDAIGDEALRDVDEMLATLDTGEFGESARAYSEPGQLREALESLVARWRSTGTRVELVLGELPRSPALTATTYRVVHEGLTNAMRHAPGAAVIVDVGLDAGDYRVRVIDDGPGTSAHRGTGFGLAGLRERVLACEGTFRSGPDAAGGFRVEASLPVTVRRAVAT